MNPGMIEFLEALALLGGTVFLIYVLTYWILAIWFRQFTTDIWLSTLRISRQPIILIVFFLGFARLLHTIEPEGIDVWVQKLFTAAAVAVGTFAIGQLFKQVVIYYLKIYADSSEARWDDVFIPIVETLAPILIWVIGGSIFFQTLGFNVAGLWVAIGGASFILGFAFKDVLANFLSGLVLLVDTPFQFGDVVSLPPKGDRAIIRKIGLRVTHLYVISEHSDMYLPNAVFEKQPIVNLTRPTPHYYDSLKILTPAAADPVKVMQVLENVVLAHPDTMGPIERKLEVLERFYGLSSPGIRQEEKRKTGLQRLSAEKDVNHKLQEIERAFDDLSEKIDEFEDAGLDESEIKIIRSDFIDICQTIGLVAKSEKKGFRGKKWVLEEADPNQFGGDHLIGKVRAWYGYWLKDPDLLREDQVILPDEWEQKINVLKIKCNKLLGRFTNISADETRLDDDLQAAILWLHDSFKRSQTEWQYPKIWVDEIKIMGGPLLDPSKSFIIRFFVDDMKLEHCERGNRVKDELYREIMWHLRNSYLSQ